MKKEAFADEILYVVASIAACETEGVSTIGNNIAFNISSEDGGIVLYLQIYIKDGHDAHKVSEEVQINSKEAIESITGIPIRRVNVHVIDTSKEDPDRVEDNFFKPQLLDAAEFILEHPGIESAVRALLLRWIRRMKE